MYKVSNPWEQEINDTIDKTSMQNNFQIYLLAIFVIWLLGIINQWAHLGSRWIL